MHLRMSEECCGPDEPRKTGTVRRIELSRPLAMGDACCAPSGADSVAGTTRTHDDGDACCGPAFSASTAVTDEIPEVRPPWWRDVALLPSVLAGVFLVAGYALEWSGLHIPGLVLLWLALLAGAYTFVPGAIRRLLRGRLGVGLLMTIAAVGAVLLGHVGEAAALAFLFSLAEALEDRAMDRAKEGLRALLSLIPETVRVSRLTGDVTIPAAEVRELDILVVGAGERVATDGWAVSSFVDDLFVDFRPRLRSGRSRRPGSRRGCGSRGWSAAGGGCRTPLCTASRRISLAAGSRRTAGSTSRS